MQSRILPITLAALAAACGASDKEVREAKTSGYTADFAVVYSETLAAVRDLYPSLNEDARAGVIKTSWHPINVQQGTDDDASKGQNAPAPGQTPNAFQTTTALRQRYFVRFDVHVVGGKPWRVRVHGQASSWKAGDIPTPLKGAEVPQWLEGRISALEVAIHRRLKGHAVALKYAIDEAPAAAAPRPLDTSKFGAIPPAAARAVAQVERAAAARDMSALRALMAEEFTFSFGDSPSADTAVVMWQADPSILAELGRAVGAGCAHDKAQAQVVCPAASLNAPDFTGYRAGFRAAGDTWKMSFFVAGD